VDSKTFSNGRGTYANKCAYGLPSTKPSPRFTDTGAVADSGSFIHDSGRGATRKAELPKLALAADGLVALGATGSNQAGFRQLATELKTMGAPLADTGVA
jgi:hypothetical protein